MNTTSNGFSLRKNFLVLLFLSIAGSVILCWSIFIFMGIISGGVFQDKSQRYIDLFMVFIFPFVISIIISIFSIILASIARQKWWISVPASIILLGTPQIAYVITWIGSWIARIFYESTPEDEERTKKFLSMSITQSEEKNVDETTKLRNMKFLADDGIITNEEFEVQKQQYMSNFQVEQRYKTLSRFFSAWQVAIAGLLGGILAGAILIAINFRRLKMHTAFTGSLIAGFIGQFIAIAIGFIMTTVVPNINLYLLASINFVYPIILYLWFNETQKQLIDDLFLEKAARGESWLITIIVGFATGILTFFCAVPIVVIIATLYPNTPISP